MEIDLEGLAGEVRRMAGLGDLEIVSALTIARRILGLPVRVVPGLATQACLALVDGRYRVAIRRLDPEAHFAVAHELGHWAFRELALARPTAEERAANRFAGALCAPAALVRAAVAPAEPAKQFRPLAKVARISETAAALRLRDLRGEQRAVVTATHRHVMGGVRGVEPERARRLAEGEERDPRIVTVRMRGGIDTGRVQLFARD